MLGFVELKHEKILLLGSSFKFPMLISGQVILSISLHILVQNRFLHLRHDTLACFRY